ncbi:hypothetical protein GDO78_011234 [Eleutherodactylus coqui]|uniref:Uncharacterized protein n=1 Tax=Eleutherodactylus coqui TaxID=57060 RepID=A0A8J6KBB3_ELECQ|nr:hypothetical protein GDO78_011234 [Eleutherodactylus coqui]
MPPYYLNADMSGPVALAVPAMRLRGWMPAIYKRVQNFGVTFGVCILLFMFGTGLVDYRACVSLIVSLMEYMMIIGRFFNSFFCNSFFLLLLWLFSIFCVNRAEETEEKTNLKVEQDAEERHEGTRLSPDLTTLVNAEKFVTLFQLLLYEEDTSGTGSIEEKICKFKIASKELEKVQIVIDSLKTQSPLNKSRRVQDLVSKFEQTKNYMELWTYAVNKAQRQLSAFIEKGMALKIWLSEALEFQEGLHSATCNSRSDIQQHFTLLLGIMKDSEVVKEKLAEYEHSACSLTTTLQEVSSCSGSFPKALEGASNQNRMGKWYDILPICITEEAAQVAQRFSTFTKINECYHVHLKGLQEINGLCLQEDSTSAVLPGELRSE